MDRLTFAFASLALLLGTPEPVRGAPAAEVSLPADSRFTIEVEGEGPDVILIPGLSSPREVWDGARAALAGKARLHLVEIKGFDGGDPGPNLEGPILDGAVAQLAAYVRDRKLKAPLVVGHSMGGLIGLMLARRHPEAVGRLMVVDALPFIGEIFVRESVPAMLEPMARGMREQMRASHGKPMNPDVVRTVAAQNAIRPETQALVAKWSAAADQRAVGQAFYEDMTTDLRLELAAIATPITLVYPWANGRVPRDRADALYRGEYARAPNMTFVPVADSAHFVMLDQPAAFEAALLAFVISK